MAAATVWVMAVGAGKTACAHSSRTWRGKHGPEWEARPWQITSSSESHISASQTSAINWRPRLQTHERMRSISYPHYKPLGRKQGPRHGWCLESLWETGCSWGLCLFFWDRVTQAGLQLVFLLPRLPTHWGYGRALPCLAPVFLVTFRLRALDRRSDILRPSIQTSTGQTCWLWIQMVRLANSTDLWVILSPTFQGYIFLSLRSETIVHRYLISFQKLSGLKMIYNSSHPMHQESGLEPAAVVFLFYTMPAYPHSAASSFNRLGWKPEEPFLTCLQLHHLSTGLTGFCSSWWFCDHRMFLIW